MIRLIIEDGDLIRLDRRISASLPDVSRSRIQRDLSDGLIRVNGSLRNAGYRVRPGETIEYDYTARPDQHISAEEIDLEVPYEDEHLAVINKKAGQVVHPGAGHSQGTLVNALLNRYGEKQRHVGGENRCGLVHRLDAQTSGLMLVARVESAWMALRSSMEERLISRKYLGLAVGYFGDQEGMIDRPIGRRKSDRKKMGVVPGGKNALTLWRVLYAHGGISLLGLRLHTGRTHQIRVHLQSISRPLLGDPTYGLSKNRTLQNLNPDCRKILVPVYPKRQMLHAVRLEFPHPGRGGDSHHIKAMPPEDMLTVIQKTMPETWSGNFDSWLSESGTNP